MREMAFGVALLGLAACAGFSEMDVRQEHWLACSAYTSALESIAVRKEAGMFDPEQLAAIRQVELQTTPLCQGAAPSAEGAALVNQALTSLEVFLVTQAVE